MKIIREKLVKEGDYYKVFHLGYIIEKEKIKVGKKEKIVKNRKLKLIDTGIKFKEELKLIKKHPKEDKRVYKVYRNINGESHATPFFKYDEKWKKELGEKENVMHKLDLLPKWAK